MAEFNPFRKAPHERTDQEPKVDPLDKYRDSLRVCEVLNLINIRTRRSLPIGSNDSYVIKKAAEDLSDKRKKGRPRLPTKFRLS